MTKIKVIARVRPFLPHEKVDDVVSVEEGALAVKDLRTSGLVTRYPFVILLPEGTLSLLRLLAEISLLVMTIIARTKPSLRSKSSRFSSPCSRVLYGQLLIAFHSAHSIL